MTTTAQRDKRIAAAEKRRTAAADKLTKAQADVAKFSAEVNRGTADIEWLRGMPVDDADGTPEEPVKVDLEDDSDDTGAIVAGPGVDVEAPVPADVAPDKPSPLDD